MAKQVVLKVDEREVKMNEFVQRALSSVVEGFIAALDDVPAKPKSIEIAIRPATHAR